MSGQHIPPDHSKGDERTIGGYAAVHGRPAAFDGSDGASYSVDILVDETGEKGSPWGAFLFFVRWSPSSQSMTGHIETSFLVRAQSAEDARRELGSWSLDEARRLLEQSLAVEH